MYSTISYDPEDTQTDKVWNIAGLPILGSLLLVLAITLIILGAVHDINDLIILGSLFILGSFMFYGIMCCTVCRPTCQRNNVISTCEFTDELQSNEHQYSRQTSTSDNYAYYNASFETNDYDTARAKNRPAPTDDQLYGNKMRQFLATPATTSDLKFDEDGETPPPPRLALPSHPNDTKAVFTMDVEKEMSKQVKEMSQIELL